MLIVSDKIEILNVKFDVNYLIYYFLGIATILFWILIFIFIVNIFKNIKNKNQISSLMDENDNLQKNMNNFNSELKDILDFMNKDKNNSNN